MTRPGRLIASGIASRSTLGPAVAGLLWVLTSAPSAWAAATITQITSFGANPTGIGMYLYTPSNVVAKPPVLVGVHACHGKGLDVCNAGNPFAQQADKYGFLLICPSAVSTDGCWDVHSTADLTHNGGGDAAGILSMVSYVIQNKGGDANRVYVAGHSSGGMMTNVLLGSYPDVFKAGAAFAGVPFACFAQGSIDNLGWSSTCANGNVTMTGAQWGALVRAAYPGFTGTRPRIQFWHGTTDATLSFHNFGEEIKEWTNVLGVSETPTSTENNVPQATWIRTRYADSAGVVQVEAIQETGQPHNLVIDGAEAIRFFGLDGSSPGTVGGADAGAGGPGPRDSGASGGGAGSLPEAGVPGAGPGGFSGGGTGGATGSGGAAVSGSGGAQRSGGSGGTAETGGAPGSGGVVVGTGGGGSLPSASGTGGSSGPPSSGVTSGTGGASGSGGSAASAPGQTASSASGSSSGCAVAGRERGGLAATAGLLVFGAVQVVARRRRRRPRASRG